MFSNVPEKQMHRVRWVLTIAWIVLIVSLFYDPISPWLTDPSNAASPLRLYLSDPSNPTSPLRIDPDICVRVQGACLEESPYALGAPIFWGMVIPTAVFILLVFGHDLWRRICPLSFLSQIPRALGWERKRKRVNEKTGKVRYELVKVAKDSWLAKNHFYLQLGLFFIGLSSRILFVNSDRIVLGVFLIGTILAAISVGFLYGGKSWCQYFCPMAPVQRIYAEPRAILNSTAHAGDRQLVTQSMCRTVAKDGKELSDCVACKSPCIDIDAERLYWESVTEPKQQWLYYGYTGVAVGYFIYYYLYSGSWEYYFSGAWAHEADQLGSLFDAGFYLFGTPIGIPKLIAVPITLAIFTVGGYLLGRTLEQRFKVFYLRQKKSVDKGLIRHRVFSLSTFFIFNFFFVFAGRNFVRLFPDPLRLFFPLLIVFCSAVWLHRTWPRSRTTYQREGFASRLRKQLKKLDLDISRFLEGRTLNSLNADEVYVLAKVLPGFSQEKRLQAYKGVLRDSLEEGYAKPDSSLETFQQLRQELQISDRDHETVLQQLEAELPDLFNPNKPHEWENLLRLESYREALLEIILESWKANSDRSHIGDLLRAFSSSSSNVSLEEIVRGLPESDLATISTIRQEYGISSDDETDALKLTNPDELWHLLAGTIGISGVLESEQNAILEKVFQQIDADRSGDISLPELMAYIKTLDPDCTEAQIREMVEMADENSDNKISYDEFCATIVCRI
ncbi:EF-hand domain-containing protein [Synechococcus sp. PCC 7336]|uniref:EF-hand domain-containing protein n=1 Tax=Synechococcus sp. PCC 7336 TaxID=195250 RepID=UPI00034508F5|nr:EF-hand domain-containing protein [Synechococcus sp. PCC 7336]